MTATKFLEEPGFYLARNPGPAEQGPLSLFEAGVILNLGDEAETFVAGLNRALGALPDFQPQAKPDRMVLPMLNGLLVLHQDGSRVLLVVGGTAALDRLQDRWRQPESELARSPAFQQALKSAGVAKFAGLTWVNLEIVRSDLKQQFGLAGDVIHSVGKSLGLSGLASILTVSGIDEADQVCRTQLTLTGEPQGLLKLLAGSPVGDADLTHVPADADFVAASSVNLRTIRDTCRDIVAKTAPDALGGFDEFQRQLELELQLKLDDIAAAFGEVWTVYDSPSGGGLLLTGLVAAAPVRNFTQAERVVQRLQELLIESLPPSGDDSGTKLEELSFQGTTIYFLNWKGYSSGDGSQTPFSPAFCLTKDQVLFALHPQALKSHLRFLQSSEPRFDRTAKWKVPAGGGELLTGVFLETPRIGRVVYPLVPLLAKPLLGEWQSQGAAVSVGSLPSARAVLPYLRDTTIAVLRRKDGILIEQRNTLPVVLSFLLAPHLRESSEEKIHFGGGIELGNRKNGDVGAPAVNLGAPEGVVQAKSEEPKAEIREPSAVEKAARRTLPFLLRGLVPDDVELLIPDEVFQKLAEPPDPEKAAQRAADRERRRQEREERRAARRLKIAPNRPLSAPIPK